MIDDREALKSLNKLEKQTGSAQKTLADFGKKAVVAGAAVGAGLAAFVSIGLRDAADAEAKIAQMDAVLKSTGSTAGMTRESLLELAEGFEKNTKFSAENALEAQNLLLTFTQIGKDTFPRATKAAADMATAMGTDMAGQSIALGKALNDPIAGIASLTRVGVQFTDEQKNTITALMEVGDVAGAQAVILSELETQFGGSAEAAGSTFAGQMIILKNQFGAVAEELAVTLMPYLLTFMEWISTNMPTFKQIASDVFTAVGDAIKWVADNANWLIPILAGVLGGFLALKIIGVVSAMIAIFNAVLAAASAAGGIFNLVMLANPLTWVVLGVVALIAAIVALVMNFDKVKTAATDLWDKIKDVFGKIRDFVKGVFDGFKNFIKMPKFEVKGSLNPLKWMSEGLPKLSVKWNADGGIFDRPTIFSTPYGLQGVGEAGPEAIMPLSKLQDLLDMNNGIDYNQLASTLKKALLGMAMQIDGDKVGELIDTRLMKGAI